MLTWLTSNAAALSIIGAAVTLAWSAIQFILVRRREQQTHEFEAFHRLIKELVSPDPATNRVQVERSIAVLFELRHFPRYYEVTTRILEALRETVGSSRLRVARTH
jgi:hypothetical protein